MKELSNSIPIDPLFDGHPEKQFKSMTPTEKIEYLWLLIKFRNSVKDLKIIKKNSTGKNNG